MPKLPYFATKSKEETLSAEAGAVRDAIDNYWFVKAFSTLFGGVMLFSGAQHFMLTHSKAKVFSGFMVGNPVVALAIDSPANSITEHRHGISYRELMNRSVQETHQQRYARLLETKKNHTR